VSRLLPAQNQNIMRSFAGLLAAAAVALGICYYYLHSLPSDHGTLARQSIIDTGVKNDLISIVQAERAYIVQNGTCASLDELTSTGSLSMTQSGREGYTYVIACSGVNFGVTATHPPAAAGAPATHYPTMSIDQSMQFRQSD